MTDRLAVREDGVVEGLFAIGYHGSVQPDRTPAMKEPVYVDEAGSLTRIVEHDEVNRCVRVERSEIRPGEVLPGDGTRLPAPTAARLGWGFLVMGDSERRFASQIAAAMRSSDPEDARAAARELQESTAGVLEWYFSLHSAMAMRDRIRVVAMHAVEQAAHARDLDELERCAWWLQRAGVDEREYLCAAAALKEAGSPHWFSVARALLRGRDRSRLEAEVEEVRLGWNAVSTRSAPEPPDAWWRPITESWRLLGLSGWAWRWEGKALIAESRDGTKRFRLERDKTLERLQLRLESRQAEGGHIEELHVRCPDAAPWDDLLHLLKKWRETGTAEILAPARSRDRGGDVGEQEGPERLLSIGDLLPRAYSAPAA